MKTTDTLSRHEKQGRDAPDKLSPIRIRRALISVSDKTGITDFAKKIAEDDAIIAKLSTELGLKEVKN